MHSRIWTRFRSDAEHAITVSESVLQLCRTPSIQRVHGYAMKSEFIFSAFRFWNAPPTGQKYIKPSIPNRLAHSSSSSRSPRQFHSDFITASIFQGSRHSFMGFDVVIIIMNGSKSARKRRKFSATQ